MEEQTQRLAAWFLDQVGEIDLAAARYRADGKVDRVERARVRVQSLDDLARLLPWLRQRNSAGHNIWVRPSASLSAHRFVMLDDLTTGRAKAITRKYLAAAVETSAGNAQCWLLLAAPLDREVRQTLVGALAPLVGADPDAKSEPRWGRLPGFRQRKPGKPGWTNLLAISRGLPALDPAPIIASLPPAPAGGGVPYLSGRRDGDGSESSREFKFAIERLRSGWPEDRVIDAIAARALTRGKRRTQAQAQSYANRTVTAALRSLRYVVLN